jgi:N-acetylmuramoyl-L-alanine amidase
MNYKTLLRTAVYAGAFSLLVHAYPHSSTHIDSVQTQRVNAGSIITKTPDLILQPAFADIQGNPPYSDLLKKPGLNLTVKPGEKKTVEQAVATTSPSQVKAVVQPINHHLVEETVSVHHRTTKVKSIVRVTTPAVRKVRVTSNSTPTTYSDVYWLSRVIEAEAGGESQACKLAVGEVILNRVHSSLYPNTIHDVIFQQDSGVYEFTCVENGWIQHAPSQASIDAAKLVLNGQVHSVPSALVFYVDAQTPSQSWVRSQAVITQIGPMTFAV